MSLVFFGHFDFYIEYLETKNALDFVFKNCGIFHIVPKAKINLIRIAVAFTGVEHRNNNFFDN